MLFVTEGNTDQESRGGICSTLAHSPKPWEPTLANCISHAENQQLFDIWAAERAPPSSHKSAGGWNILRASNSHPSQTYPTRVHTPKHTSRLKQRGGVPASPMCTDQSARATKGRCVPQRCPDRERKRYACIWLRSPSSGDARSLRGRGSSGVTLARPGGGGWLLRCSRIARATLVARPWWRPRQVSCGARSRLSALRAPRRARLRGNPTRLRAPPQVAAA